MEGITLFIRSFFYHLGYLRIITPSTAFDSRLMWDRSELACTLTNLSQLLHFRLQHPPKVFAFCPVDIGFRNGQPVHAPEAHGMAALEFQDQIPACIFSCLLKYK